MEIKRTKRDIFTWTFLFSVFTTILITGVCPADAHRIFAVTEYGKVQEIKKGKLQRKVGAAKIADFDSKKPKMIPDPMKFYVYLEDEYDPDEWCVSQIGNNMFLGTYFKTEAITDKKAFQKNSDVKQISEKIIE